MRCLKTLVVMLAVPTVAWAQVVWSWEDRNGQKQYTDTPASIPKHAKRVQAFRLERLDAPASTETTTATTAQPRVDGTASRAADARTATSTVVVHGSQARVWQDSAQLDEAQWRDRFIEVHRRISSLEVRLAAARALNLSPMSCSESACVPNPEYERLQAQLAQLSSDLFDARGDLEQLDRKATIAGAPREWRRGW